MSQIDACTSEAPCMIDSEPSLRFHRHNMEWRVVCTKCDAVWWRFKTIRQLLAEKRPNA